MINAVRRSDHFTKFSNQGFEEDYEEDFYHCTYHVQFLLQVRYNVLV